MAALKLAALRTPPKDCIWPGKSHNGSLFSNLAGMLLSGFFSFSRCIPFSVLIL